ncbi:hypothetical protein PVIIG_06420 [Plasmodium vivax India VII]|uniref:Uncharacterized protein n=1 Tax=Plasmodium vivax India VII TaxID=1077284 RepID=A0A0J9S372_PLAVI|nr:hypothetical protein PVIIG_06420 [Plasmodium vivax India VII]
MYNDSYKDMFYLLAGAFTEGHAFSEIGQIPCCKLINYMLNTKLKDTYQQVDKTKFKVFNEFADIFSKKYIGFNNACKHHMYYLEGDEFKKMKILYTLYDEFLKYTTDREYNIYNICSYHSVLRHHYNLLLNEYDGMENNDELLDKLKQFKELLRRKVSETQGNCLNQIEYFKTPTSYTEIKQKEEQAAKEKEQERERAAKEAEQERERAAKEAQALQVAQIPQEIHETQDELQISSSIQSNYVDTPLPDRFRLGNIQTNHIDSQLYKPEDTRSTFPSGEGIIHSIKGTFNSIVEIVEPAPILGVSGGMGVLFIILKVLKILKS